MFGGLFTASTIYQRELVKAHDRTWVVCLALETAEKDGDTRFAIAAPCDEAGNVELPSELQLISFIPQHVAEKRALQIACEAEGHVLQDKEFLRSGKMVRSCRCFKVEGKRDPTPEELKNWR